MTTAPDDTEARLAAIAVLAEGVLQPHVASLSPQRAGDHYTVVYRDTIVEVGGFDTYNTLADAEAAIAGHVARIQQQYAQQPASKLAVEALWLLEQLREARRDR